MAARRYAQISRDRGARARRRGAAAVAIFGGFAPFIATFLLRATGNKHAPAAYVVIAALVTLVILLRTPETAFAPLR
jgi:hypothetical protein